MYHGLLRRRVTEVFDAASRGDAERLLDTLAPRFEHSLVGDHCLGGSRRTVAATAEWYGRLYRLMPDMRFTVTNVSLSGNLHRAIVVVDWTSTSRDTDGSDLASAGLHLVEICWGKVTRVSIAMDTVPLNAMFDRLAASGVAEAHADPILDGPIAA